MEEEKKMKKIKLFIIVGDQLTSSALGSIRARNIFDEFSNTWPWPCMGDMWAEAMYAGRTSNINAKH